MKSHTEYLTMNLAARMGVALPLTGAVLDRKVIRPPTEASDF
jgi:hypothetical protein